MNKFAKIGVAAAVGCGGLYAASSSFKKEAPVPAFNPKAYVPFPLKEVEPITHNTSKFRFSLPTSNSSMGMDVASCVVVKVEGADGKAVERPYTPTSLNDELGYFDLVVKRYNGGAMSTRIFDLKPGDKLLVKGPIQKLKYEANKWKHVGLIAGGTGITPMYQVAREIARNPNDKTEVDIIFGNLTEDDILMKKELDQLAKDHKNIRVHYTIDKPSSNWTGLKGHVSRKMVESILPGPKPDTYVLVCGPPGMMNAVSGPKAKDWSQGEIGGLLKEIGYDMNKVYKM